MRGKKIYVWSLAAAAATLLVAAAVGELWLGESTDSEANLCPGAYSGADATLPPVGEGFLRAFAPSFEVTNESFVRMTLTLRNTRNWNQTLRFPADPPHSFTVTTATDCKAVWHGKGRVTEAGASWYLDQGEERKLRGEWPLVDTEGQPVRPGEYLVHVHLGMEDPRERLTMSARVRVNEIQLRDVGKPLYAALEDPATLCPVGTEAITNIEITDPNDKVMGVFWKYGHLFRSHPNYQGAGAGPLSDENGEPTETMGIIVEVSVRTNGDTGIPTCLEGVPIQVVVGPGKITPGPVIRELIGGPTPTRPMQRQR